MVFVCSPYRGKTKRNVREACKFSRWIAKQGVAPIAPHLLFPQFLDDAKAQERALALSLNEQLIALVDEVWVLSGQITSGMRREIFYARQCGKPVRFFRKLKGVKSCK